jgi:tRNA pseudouridine synthase 10
MLPAFGARTGRFHGAGREDIDVLMLGSGRPLVFEVIGARNPQVDLDALRKEIEQRSDGQIELAPFVAVRKDRVAYWKQTNFEKIYRAEVALSAEPASLDAAAAFAGKTLQRTPQRVAHRRADLDREREVKVLSVTRIGDLRLELRLQCQHGTYVKEFISGDEGRTTPSLASLLGVDARCDVLDVEEILTPKSSFADGV